MYVESNQPDLDTHMWDILGHYIKIKILIIKSILELSSSKKFIYEIESKINYTLMIFID